MGASNHLSSDGTNRPGIAYLFSRYPVPSQTFCDWEILSHEDAGFPVLIASLNPAPGLFRHDHFSRISADIIYPPAAGLSSSGPDIPEGLAAYRDQFSSRFGDGFSPDVRAINAAYFGQLLSSRGITHCHVHFANQATITARMMKELGLGMTYSFTAHGQDFTTDLGDDEVLRELCDGAEFVVAVSDSARDLIAETCPDSADRVHRVYNGIGLDRFPAAAPETLGEDGRLEIVSIGRLIEFKGFLPLVDACGLLRDRGVNFRCTIVGDGPLRDKIADRIESLKLMGSVVLAGLQPQQAIRDLLESANVFALGSIVDSKGAMDTLPTVITEAMACRLPVVSTRLAGIPEMVIDGQTGRLVEPGDSAGMADALAELAADPEARKAMGNGGRRLAEQRFALATCAGQLRDLLTSHIPDQPKGLCPAIFYLGGDDPLPSVDEELAAVAENQSVAVLRPNTDLPDASILEAHWLASPTQRQVLEELRRSLPRKFRGEVYYSTARRAVFLARSIKAQDFGVIHAVRASDCLLVWMCSHLSGIPATATIERETDVPRSLLKVLLKTFRRVSVGDDLIRETFGGEECFEDVLELSKPPRTQMKIGPLKVSHSSDPPPFDRKRVDRWLQLLTIEAANSGSHQSSESDV